MNRKELLKTFLKYTQKLGITQEGIGEERIVTDFIESKGIELMDLVTLLEILPGKIRDNQEAFDKKTEEKNLLEYMNKSLAAEVALKVSMEKEGEKDKYKNKEQREKATTTRLTNDEKYSQNKKDILNLFKELKEIERTIDFLNKSHRSAIGKTRLLGRD